jgi:hypothetical protein
MLLTDQRGNVRLAEASLCRKVALVKRRKTKKPLTEATFHLYQKDMNAHQGENPATAKRIHPQRSTLFDLIQGQKEPKQTKGLAYVFSTDFKLVFEFLRQKELAPVIAKLFPDDKNLAGLEKEIRHIECRAEQITVENNRADIILLFKCRQMNRKEPLAVVIEAKGVGVKDDGKKTKEQLQKYTPELPELNFYEKKLQVTLTKYPHKLATQNDAGNTQNVSITWSDNVINFLEDYGKKNQPAKEYLRFITGVDKNMHYYEEEVLCISARKSIPLIDKHQIYVCGQTDSKGNKKTLYVAFTKTGGIMDRLYKVKEIRIIDISDYLRNKPLGIRLLNDSADDERLYEYIKDDKIEEQIRVAKDKEASNQRKFFILDKDFIDLKDFLGDRLPYKKYIQSHLYYSIAEMLKGGELPSKEKRPAAKSRKREA